MSKEVINWTQGDVMNQFISGNIAMMVNGPWQVPTMREQAPDPELGCHPAAEGRGIRFLPGRRELWRNRRG